MERHYRAPELADAKKKREAAVENLRELRKKISDVKKEISEAGAATCRRLSGRLMNMETQIAKRERVHNVHRAREFAIYKEILADVVSCADVVRLPTLFLASSACCAFGCHRDVWERVTDQMTSRSAQLVSRQPHVLWT